MEVISNKKGCYLSIQDPIINGDVCAEKNRAIKGANCVVQSMQAQGYGLEPSHIEFIKRAMECMAKCGYEIVEHKYGVGNEHRI